MSYVDGFVIAIPRKNLPAYRKMAAQGGKLWRKYGALDYKECVGEDLKPTMMGGAKGATFPGIMKKKPSEVIIFSYIVFKSRKHRDQVNAKVMNDPAMSPDAWQDKPMPFEMSRMVYGGFDVFVEAK